MVIMQIFMREFVIEPFTATPNELQPKKVWKRNALVETGVCVTKL